MDINQIKAQLAEINNKRIRYQTLKEQAISQCEAIKQKYGVNSLEELELLVKKAQADYDNSVQIAQKYIEDTNRVFASYQGVI